MTQVLANPADLPTRTKVLAFTLMCIGFFMATLDIQIVASSLKDIGGGLSASQDELSWVQTSYLIAEILVIPMSGWLTRVFSTRWVFAFSALGFTVTSMLCGLAWDINSMILFRGLQGALGAAMIPTVFTTAFVLFPGKQRLIASTTISALATLFKRHLEGRKFFPKPAQADAKVHPSARKIIHICHLLGGVDRIALGHQTDGGA